MPELDNEWPKAYEGWISSAGKDLEASNWGEAFRTYPWPRYTSSPWTPLAKPLEEARIAVVSSGGLSLPGQTLFDETVLEGDAGIRIVQASDLPLWGWQVRHGHYDPTAAQADYNVIMPIDVVKALAEDGVVGALAPRHVSFLGFQTNVGKFMQDTVPPIAEMFRDDGVDAVLLVPV